MKRLRLLVQGFIIFVFLLLYQEYNCRHKLRDIYTSAETEEDNARDSLGSFDYERCLLFSSVIVNEGGIRVVRFLSPF